MSNDMFYAQGDPWAEFNDETHTWFLSLNSIPYGTDLQSAGQIIIPVEQLDGLTDEDIGQRVRTMAAQLPQLRRLYRQAMRDTDPHPGLTAEEHAAQVAANAPRGQHSRPGFIYLIRSDENYYKIGRTNNVEKRIREFGIQLPFAFELVHTIAVEDTPPAEKYLHTKFDDKRLNGEWFALSPEDVAWICSLTHMREGFDHG